MDKKELLNKINLMNELGFMDSETKEIAIESISKIKKIHSEIEDQEKKDLKDKSDNNETTNEVKSLRIDYFDRILKNIGYKNLVKEFSFPEL